MKSLGEIKRWACKVHEETNHKYAKEYPYSFHLEMVANEGHKFIHLIPEQDQRDVLSACWCHDLIEDCRLTYNDVKQETNEAVAELVYALTNEKGRNRKERANDKYYAGIKNTKYAVFVKLCDRIANVKFSLVQGSSMFEMYRKENLDFIMSLGYGEEILPKYAEMFEELNSLFTPPTQGNKQ